MRWGDEPEWDRAAEAFDQDAPGESPLKEDPLSVGERPGEATGLLTERALLPPEPVQTRSLLAPRGLEVVREGSPGLRLAEVVVGVTVHDDAGTIRRVPVERAGPARYAGPSGIHRERPGKRRAPTRDSFRHPVRRRRLGRRLSGRLGRRVRGTTG